MNAIETYLIKNWKTSAAGVVMIVLAALEAAGVDLTGVTHMSPGELLFAALTGFGLIAAKDAGKP